LGSQCGSALQRIACCFNQRWDARLHGGCDTINPSGFKLPENQLQASGGKAFVLVVFRLVVALTLRRNK
jgi:hypothetical protein